MDPLEAPRALHSPNNGGDDSLRVNIGFVPLTDSAPIIIAKERGFFRRHGLQVTLSRQPSWSNVRDKLTAGLLDAAPVLAPMALASGVGANGFSTPLVTAMSLDLNGNAITVSPELFRRMVDLDPNGMLDRPRSARPLRRVLDERRRKAERRVTLAVVFPFSAHAYDLRYWLAAAGIDPERDLRIVVAAPPTMVGLLKAGRIDGFCVGEPWSSYAFQIGCGKVVVSKYDIWNNSPEKVFAVTRAWHQRHPGAHAALIRALIEAGRWLDDPENRLEAAHVIAGESFIDAPVEVVRCSLLGHFNDGDRDRDSNRDFHVFYRYAATFPWCSHALWLLGQMWRWGQIEHRCDLAAVAASVYLPDFYREAAVPLNVAMPRTNWKAEGIHSEPWTLGEATQPLLMGSDTFIDRREFHPESWREYLSEEEVVCPRIPLGELSA